ncbi:MAG: FAD-dependent oxidoreductase, partial [Gammaproteobacteria bacterium]|nr:FAD-dependent oxidoreductase [Gammaproteobacteria bacterium]
MSIKELNLPDIGDFESVEVIEVHITVGSSINQEDPLVTLESDKATMDIPSPFAGKIKTVTVAVGDKISVGSQLGTVESTDIPAAADDTAIDQSSSPKISNSGANMETEVLVLGAGPGGYTAAFRASDLGKKVTLVERYDSLGGVCLNVGCIPSKALLHTAQVINEAEHMKANGIDFGKPKIDLDGVRGFKDKVVNKLTGGLKALAKQRKVEVVTGLGSFVDANTMAVEKDGKITHIRFENCIIAAGSQATEIPPFPNDDPRLMDSTDALDLTDVPKKLLIVGGGIIGLEMATVYDALGSEITVVEFMDSLIPGCDKDLVRPLSKLISKRYKAIYLKTKVSEIKAQKNGLKVSFEGDKAPDPQVYDKVLVAVGRRPNGLKIGAANAGVEVDEAGFISVDNQMRTNVPNIFAIGDIVGQPMLAHKATHEAK